MSMYEKANHVAEMISRHADGDEIDNGEAEVLLQCFLLLKWSKESAVSVRDAVRKVFDEYRHEMYPNQEDHPNG